MSDQEVQAAPPAPTSTKKAIAIALVAAIAGGGASSIIVARQIAKPAAKVVATEDTARSAQASIHLLENLVLNPAGTNGTRFLMAAVAIETKSSTDNDRMNKRDAELRDVILGVLGARTIDQLSTLAEREPLRKEVMDSVNAMFGPGVARSVYFPQFVIQ